MCISKNNISFFLRYSTWVVDSYSCDSVTSAHREIVKIKSASMQLWERHWDAWTQVHSEWRFLQCFSPGGPHKLMKRENRLREVAALRTTIKYLCVLPNYIQNGLLFSSRQDLPPLPDSSFTDLFLGFLSCHQSYSLSFCSPLSNWSSC